MQETPRGYRKSKEPTRFDARLSDDLSARQLDPRVIEALLSEPESTTMFSGQQPVVAGTLRGMVWATVALVIMAVVEILQTQTDALPQWWPVLLTPVIIQMLRLWEGYIDQRAND